MTLIDGSCVIAEINGSHARLVQMKNGVIKQLRDVHMNEYGFWKSHAGRFFSNPIPCGYEEIERTIGCSKSFNREEWESMEEHMLHMRQNAAMRQKVMRIYGMISPDRLLDAQLIPPAASVESPDKGAAGGTRKGVKSICVIRPH